LIFDRSLLILQFIQNVTGVKRNTDLFADSDMILSDPIKVGDLKVAFLDTPGFDNSGFGIPDFQVVPGVQACIDSM
jgi:hypothetical protein